MKPILFLVLICAPFIALAESYAQESPAKKERIAYSVKYADAKNVAEILKKHFQEEGELQVLPDLASNLLLINASPKTLAEAMRIVEALDRRPHAVAVNVVIAEIVPKKGNAGMPPPKSEQLTPKDFTGSKDEVFKKIADLTKKQVLTKLRQFRIVAVENQPGKLFVGADVPVVTGAISSTAKVAGIPTVSRTISYSPVSYRVDFKVRVTDGKTVLVDLKLEHSGVEIPEDGIVISKLAGGEVIRAFERTQGSLTTKVNVRSGQAVVAKHSATLTKVGTVRTFVIVTAQILNADVSEAE